MALVIPRCIFRRPKLDNKHYKTARIRSRPDSWNDHFHRHTCASCSSVQQGTVRDCGVQIPRQKGRLRLGRHSSHPHPLFEAAEADFRGLRELRVKVGSIAACLRFFGFSSCLL